MLAKRPSSGVMVQLVRFVALLPAAPQPQRRPCRLLSLLGSLVLLTPLAGCTAGGRWPNVLYVAIGVNKELLVNGGTARRLLKAGRLDWIPCRSTVLPALRRVMGGALGVSPLPDGEGHRASPINRLRVLALGRSSSAAGRRRRPLGGVGLRRQGGVLQLRERHLAAV